MSAPLTLFNSLTRSLEVFTPIDPKMVRLYSCGPTVYNFAHLGNLRAYVFTDTLRRVLNWKGYAVTHVINITDVGHLTSDADAGEDKMERAASAAGKTIWDIAAFFTAAFKADLKALNIREPTIWSTATDHVQDMIAFTQAIEKHTYPLESGLYFDTTSVPDYGRLAGSATDETVGRIAEVEGKRHPADFAVWRKSPAGETRQMEWESPWGPGAPGWHLECSVMSMKYLGQQFDIHTGGIDHREIHHPNEIAQNQAFTGCQETGANIWMHNNFLVDRGAKMSKSSGGFSTLASIVERGVHPLAYRLLCLSAHYRSELDFSADSLGAALTRLKRLVGQVEKLRAEVGPQPWMAVLDQARDGKGASYRWQLEALGELPPAPLAAFDDAIAADLNLPRALPLVEEVASDRTIPAGTRLRLVAAMDLALGLDLMHVTRAALRVRPGQAALDAAAIEERLAGRKEARAAKDFARSDAIRDELNAAGVEIMDGDPLGWDWRVDLA
ncbi:cysteine--tRNA ligase [Sphingomonas quercus]|uniref:Cysteine--tRNA ligase n=1 Tax=Sphingomonas quercus TaxID=2842451 RepID=A0ABS6BDF9_9SPHN|nr:cysteine--tRNA ligase [Sphingomonas quercus]MBU3076353.1 cysteine--tRNA ligase [Sphingomonas quercus]